MTQPVAPVPDIDPAAEHDGHVSREQTSTEQVDVSRETDRPDVTADARDAGFDTPIAREAAQAVQVMNVRQERWPRPVHPRVLTVANQKGGVGKTTSAVNLAAALALHGLTVCLIDLDPQGNASTALGIDHSVGTPSTYDVLLGGRALADVAQTTQFTENL